jgi:hypothetical protein
MLSSLQFSLCRIVDKHIRIIVGKYLDTKFIKVDAEVSGGKFNLFLSLWPTASRPWTIESYETQSSVNRVTGRSCPHFCICKRLPWSFVSRSVKQMACFGRVMHDVTKERWSHDSGPLICILPPSLQKCPFFVTKLGIKVLPCIILFR